MNEGGKTRKDEKGGEVGIKERGKGDREKMGEYGRGRGMSGMLE